MVKTNGLMFLNKYNLFFEKNIDNHHLNQLTTEMFLKEYYFVFLMELNKDVVKNIARVSRLNLSDAEIDSIEKDMNEVLDAFSKISEVDTTGVEMSIQPIKINTKLREDEVTSSLSNEDALSLTKNKKDGFIMGPSSL